MKRTALLAGLLVILGLASIAPFAVRFLAGNDPPAPADAIVVLAGGRFTTGRLREGLRLYDVGYATNLIVSGVEFDPHNANFVPVAYDMLQQRGLNNFLLDTNSAITRVTSQLVARLAHEQHWQRVLVITSAFHWRRTAALFNYDSPRHLDIRIGTVPDVDWERWWTKPFERRLVRNEYWFLTTFLLFHTPAGLLLLLVCLLLAVHVTRAGKHQTGATYVARIL